VRNVDRAIVYNPKSPKAARDELVRTIKVALDATSDANQFIESAFKSMGSEGSDAYSLGIEKAKNTVTQEAGLFPPVVVTFKNVDIKSKQLSLEVIDFDNRRVRAIFDINGILVRWRQM